MSERYEYPATEFDEPKKTPGKGRGFYFAVLLGLAAFIAILDHVSKKIIVHHIVSGQAKTIIPGVLRITHVLNSGAAFSFLADTASPGLVLKVLILFSVVAVIVVGVLLIRSCNAITLTSVALALILGGAIGNLYDRVVYHYVIDFIEVTIVHYHWPDFNIADSAISIGACLLMIEIFRPQPETKS